MLSYLDKQYYRSQIFFEKQQFEYPKNQILKGYNQMINTKTADLSQILKKTSQKFRNINNEQFKPYITDVHPEKLTKTAQTAHNLFNEINESNEKTQSERIREDEHLEFSYQNQLIGQKKILLAIVQVYDKIHSSSNFYSPISKKNINLEEYQNYRQIGNRPQNQNIDFSNPKTTNYIAYTDKPSIETSQQKSIIPKKKHNQHRPRHTQIHKSTILQHSFTKYSKNLPLQYNKYQKSKKQQKTLLVENIKNRILNSSCTMAHLKYQTQTNKDAQMLRRLAKEQNYRKNVAKIAQISWK